MNRLWSHCLEGFRDLSLTPEMGGSIVEALDSCVLVSALRTYVEIDRAYDFCDSFVWGLRGDHWSCYCNVKDWSEAYYRKYRTFEIGNP